MKIICDDPTRPRIDKYLSSLEIEALYSRTLIDRLIGDQKVQVNGKPVKKSHHLEVGEEIEIELPEPVATEIEPEDIPLTILFEDEYLIAVDKPAGLTVHPAPGNHSGTLVNALVHHFGEELSTGSDPMRPGIVHRLDKDTSGIMLVAKDDRTHSLLSQLFQLRLIEKHYRALTVGVPREEPSEIRTGIARSHVNRKKMCVSGNGKEAVSIFRVERDLDYFGLLDVQILTGRTHQIRVHLSHIGYPVLGDRTYSTQKVELNALPSHLHKRMKYLWANHMNRQALHAMSIAFRHPVTNEELSLYSSLPDDFVKTIDYLEKMMEL